MFFMTGMRGRSGVRRWLAAAVALILALGAAPAGRPAQAAVDPDTHYQLVNRFTGKVLDVAAKSTENGGVIQQWSGNGGNNQQWRFVEAGGGYFRLINRHSGRSMEVANWSTSSGERIQQWDYNGGAWQLWRLIDAGGGYVAVENRHSGLVLDVAGASTAEGARIQQWGYGQSAWQQWKLVPVGQDGPLGWASVAGAGLGGTTGGAGGQRVTATTIDQFATYARSSAPLIITVAGQLRGTVTVASNKTIVGAPGAIFTGSLRISNAQNVIVRDLTVRGYNCADNPVCKDGADAIGVTNSHHLWFDHLAVSDGSDGNLDITQGSDFITVSWCTFSYSGATRDHRFSNLISASDEATGDRGKLNITFHHNWWGANVDQRMPRPRFGKVHVFNNLYTATGNLYAVGAGFESKLLLENNLFVGTNAPHTVRDGGQLVARGNLYTNTSGARETAGAAFAPPYAYQLAATSGLEAAIRSGAGPR